MMDVVEEFNKLRQEGSMQSYQLRFEELKSLMLILNPHLMEGYFVSSFVSGLSEELRLTVKIQPKTIKQVAKCARLQELTIVVLMRKHKWPLQAMNFGMLR